MPMVNPFDVFSVSDICAAINIIPNRYGRLGELGMFPVRGCVSSSIAVEEKNGSLALIPAERAASGGGSGPGVAGRSGKGRVRTFSVPKLVEDDYVSPQDVQGLRAFGSNEQAGLATLLNDKLATARAKHEITLEHLRMGAVKGIILDADGTTVLSNLYTEFGIAQKTVDFVLGTAGTDVKAKCLELKRHIEDNLLGDRMDAVHVLVSPEFFDKLTSHANVKAAYAGYQEASQRLGGDLRTGFTFGGITFEEYRGVATGSAGTPVRFIAAGEGHAFPIGTMDSFATHVAPADFNETVGSLGQLYYAKTMPSKFDRGWDIHTQSNPLPLCHRPGVLVKVFSSN